MALFLATASLTFNLPSALRAPATPLHARRSATPLAYVGQDEEAGVILWNRTPGGMKFKETSKGSGEEVAEGSEEVVTIAYTAKVMNTDNVFERRTSENPLTLALNDREQAIFREAVAGMAVGGTRRMLLPPDSSFAVEGSENTVEFEIELLDVVEGPKAAFVRFGGFRGLFRLAIVLSFVPDLIHLVQGTPGDAATLAQAGDAAAAAASAAPEIYNRWVGDLSAIGL